MTSLLLLITGSYLLFMLVLLIGLYKIPKTSLQHTKPEIAFSIVVVYRNEADNLPLLLNSFLRLRYPSSLFEILLVNDASEDQSAQICTVFKRGHPEINMQLLENKKKSGSPKKSAISSAIKKAKFEYIITTDADCEIPPYWLQAYSEKLLTTGALLIAGPVQYKPVTTLPGIGPRCFSAFQEMDFMSLQGVGAGAFGIDQAFLCNGANLCYRKESFSLLGGYKGNDHISSGDDVFLLQKFSSNNFRVEYLQCREAIVFTCPPLTFEELISQRIRWAAKTPAYKSLFAKLLGLVVLLVNISLLISGLLALISWIPYHPVLMVFLAKFAIDLALLWKSATFFNRKEVLRNYFWGSLVYPFFGAYIATRSLLKGYTWKGRRFKS